MIMSVNMLQSPFFPLPIFVNVVTDRVQCFHALWLAQKHASQ